MPLATDVYITPASKKIEFYQSSALKAQISGSNGDIYVSGAADVILDAAGLDVLFKSNGTTYGKFSNNGSNWDFNGNAGTSYLRFIPYQGVAYWGDTTHNQTIYIGGTSGYGTLATKLSNTYLQQYDGAGNSDTYIQAGGNSYIKGGNLGLGGTTSPGETLHVQGTGRFTGKVAFGGSTLPTNTGISVVDTIQLSEKGSSPTATTAWGTVWVSGSTPNKLYFTDDAGTAHDLTAGGGGTIAGSLSSGKLAIGTATDTIGNFVDALTEDNSIYIGANPASTTSTAEYNLAIGKSAMSAVTTGDSNTAVGARALLDLTEGSTNTAVGYNAGENVTTGGSNTLIGYDAGKGADTESNNVALGAGALRAAANSWNTAIGVNAARVYTGHSIVALGYEAGSQNVSGGGNTILGNVAFYNHAGGASNIVIGSGSMAGDGTNKPSSSSNNTSIGVNSMKFTSGSQSSVALGNGALAGAANNTSNYNVAIGYKAASGTTGGDNNVAIGYESLLSVSSGYENAAVGYLTMKDITTGKLNVAIGAYAATGNTTGQENVAVGASALQENQEGDEIVAVGRYALYNYNPSAGTGDSVAVGANAAFTYSTGVQSVFIGRRAGYLATTANNLVVIGREAGYNLTTGSSNVLVGMRAGYNVTKGAENVMIGQSAGQNYAGTTSGVYGAFGVFIGHAAGYAVTGNHSYGSIMAIGHQPMYNATGAKKSIAIGQSAVVSGTNAEDVVALGNAAGAYADATGSTLIGNKAGFRSSGNYNTVVGYRAMSGSSSGDTSNLNVAIGYTAMEDSTSASENVAVGSYAGANLTTGDYNTAVGYAALRNGETTNRNVAVGYAALNSFTQSGDLRNTAVGMYAMLYPRSGNNNIAMGYGAMQGANSTYDSDYNVALGSETLFAIAGADNNTAVGFQALRSTTDATNNIAVGLQAMYLNTTGNYNTTVGAQALYNNVHGDRNTAIGFQALHSSTPSDGGGQNTAVGDRAGYKTTTGHSNVYLGYIAGYELLAGERNVIIGHEAGRNATSLNFSTIIGNAAGYNVSGASEVVYIGRNAGYHVTGNENTFVGTSAGIGQAAATHATQGSVAIGENAMYYNSTANYNVAVGQNALLGKDVSPWMTGDNNVAVGRETLRNTTTGHTNAALGYQAGYNVTEAIRSQFIGGEAGGSVTTAQYNTIMGYQAGHSLTVTGNNVLIGKYAGRELTKDFSTMVGINAGQNTSTGVNNTYIGASAAKNSSTGYYNVAVGNNAGNYLSGATGVVDIGYGAGFYVSGNGNVFIGLQAGMGDATQTTNHANYNVGIGYESMKDITSGFYNIGMGMNSLANITGGDYNVALGNQAGEQITTQNENTLVGAFAGQDLTGQYNVFLGSSAGFNATSADNNVAIGRQALGSAVMTGDSNVAIGYTAGHTATSALANVLVGQGAGYGITTAQKSVVIGNNAGYAMATQGGSVIVGFEAGRFQDAGSGGSVAIGHQALYSGTQNYQDVAIGYNAGRKATGASSSNVFLGTHAGPSSTGVVQNKLYINNAEGTPLIGGDFSAFQVHMNANVGIGNTNPQAKLHLSAGSSSEPLILIENTNADNTPPGVTFYKNTASPASGDQVGSIKFDSEEATSGDRKTYWEIQSRINDPTNTTPNGQLNFYGLDGDSPGFIHQFQFINSQFSVLNSDGVGPTIAPTGTNGALFKSAGSKMRLQAKSDSTGEIHMMAHNVGIDTTSPQERLHVKNGNIKIEDSTRSMTLDPYFVVSGDNQYSMISGSEGLALYGGNSYTDIWIDGQNSRQLRLRSVASDGSFDAGSFLEVFPSSVGATGDATANIRASSGDLYLYSVGSNNIALDSHHNLQFFFDNEYNMYSAADGNTRFTIRAASVAGMEFDGSSKIAFKNAASTKMTLDTANGRLGIGTTAPNVELHVNGDGRFEENHKLYFSDSATDVFIRGASSDLELHSGDDIYINATDDIRIASDQVTFADDADNVHLTIKESGTNAAQFLAAGVNSFVLKDDTGIIFDNNMGIQNSVATLGEWLQDSAGSSLEVNVQGYSKIQIVSTGDPNFPPINWGALSAGKVNLPSAVVGMEYIINWSSVQSNLSGKTFTLNPAGSDAIYKAGVAGVVGINKNTGESIHVICAETGKWSVVAHT